jgi:predicted RNase H-like HicB family nuclease
MFMKTNNINDLPYARILIPDPESGRYTAEVLELPGCFSEGATPKEAYDNIEEACRNWIESAQEQGMEIPSPLASQGFNGKVALRLPKTIHRKAIQFAAKEGVSLNQFLLSAISARVGAEDVMERIASRIDNSIERLSNHQVVIIGPMAHDYSSNQSTANITDFSTRLVPTATTLPLTNYKM